jgi:uncharacterized membrane protein
MNNIHPILVHFPIALLTIYALLEVASLKFVPFSTYARDAKGTLIKGFLVIVGSISTIGALVSGEGAEHELLTVMGELGGDVFSLSHLIETHSTYATLTAIVFAIIALSYLSLWFSSVWNENTILKKIDIFFSYLRNQYMISLLALIGLVLVTITGALGGALAYGPDIDPVVTYIYRLVI